MPQIAHSISANALAQLIKADISSFDHTLPPTALCVHFERVTKQYVSFTALVLAMIQAGFSAVPRGRSLHFVQTPDALFC